MKDPKEQLISTETKLEKGEEILRAARKKKQAKRNTLAAGECRTRLGNHRDGVEQLRSGARP